MTDAVSVCVSLTVGVFTIQNTQFTVGPCPTGLTATLGATAAECYVSGAMVSLTLPGSATIPAGTAFTLVYEVGSVNAGGDVGFSRTITVGTYNGDHFSSTLVDSGTATLTWPETVTFDANGGTGVMQAQTAAGSTALTTNAFTRAGHTFMGWNTDHTAAWASYMPGAFYDFSTSITLYAVWQAAAQPVVNLSATSIPATAGTPITPLTITTQGMTGPVTFTVVTRTGQATYVPATLPAGLTITPTGATTAEITGTPTTLPVPVGIGESTLITDLRSVTPADRTAEHVTQLQSLATSMLSQLRSVLGGNISMAISVRNTPTGAVIVGLARNPDTGESIDIPVQDVTLVTGGGLVLLTPGADGEVAVMSTPRLIGDFAVGDSGEVAEQAGLPRDLELGHHTVVVTVGDEAASLGFRLVPAATVTPEATSGTTSVIAADGTDNSLPTTGSNRAVLPWALLFMALGTASLVASTRRRHA